MVDKQKTLNGEKAKTWSKQLKRRKNDERLYSKNEIYSILKDGEGSTFPQQLSELFAHGQTDLCLQVISDLSVECSDFKISDTFVAHLKEEFIMMGFSTAHNYAKKWIDSISHNTLGIRNHCLLLKQLICCTDLLQNKQLQALLHEILPQTYHHLCCIKQHSFASIIAEVIFYSIALPATYSDDCDREALWNVWNGLMNSKECVKSAHFHLCTILVMVSLNIDCTEHIKLLIGSKINDPEENDNFLLNSKKQFLVLLERNLGAILSRCQPKQSEQLLEFLIVSYLENNDLNLLIRKIFCYPELTNTYASQILQQFFRCLLLNLSMVMDEDYSQQKENFGAWIEKSLLEILRSNSAAGNELESWKSVMSTLLPASSHTLSSPGKHFCQIIHTICGEEFRLEMLPISIRVAIFCVLISLISCVPTAVFGLTIESILSIMRSETKLFRSLLSSCKEKILRKYIRTLLRRGFSDGVLKSAQLVVKEFLVSSGNLDMLIVKCDAVLKNTTEQLSTEEQYYYLKPVCDVLCEIHYKMNAAESSILRIYVEKVFKRVYEFASPVDCKNITKMALFELALSLLLTVQILREKDAAAEGEIDEGIAEHIEVADQLCKTMCKHPERLMELGIISEQLSQLLKTSISWMIRRGKLRRIISSKYIRNFELYDEAVVREIINNSSEEMLKTILHSLLIDSPASKKFVLYSTLAKHENEAKKKLLSIVLNDILGVVIDVAGTNYLAAVCFLQQILPIASGTAYEKEFVSLAFAILAANSEFLALDFVALSNGVALLLDCLRFGANSVINDQCSLYVKLFVCAVKAVQKYANGASVTNPKLVRHLAYGLAKIAHNMIKHERSFSRVAPFIISECLDDAKHTLLALFRVFSMCDSYSIALLTTNLPPLQKARFVHLHPQFTKINKIVV